MNEPPKMIFANLCVNPAGGYLLSGTLRLEPDEIAATLPYILQSDHLAQLAEAEARAMERAANKIAGGAAVFTVNKKQEPAFNAVETLRAAADAIRAEAAAIRAGKGEA